MRSNQAEIQTRNPPITNLALYHTATSAPIGHYEHLKCVKTVWRLRAKISFASVEKIILATTLSSWLYAMVNFLNEATTGRRLRPGALLIICINIVRGAKRLWGESSMGRNAHGAKRLWGEMSFHGAKCPWGEKS